MVCIKFGSRFFNFLRVLVIVSSWFHVCVRLSGPLRTWKHSFRSLSWNFTPMLITWSWDCWTSEWAIWSKRQRILHDSYLLPGKNSYLLTLLTLTSYLWWFPSWHFVRAAAKICPWRMQRRSWAYPQASPPWKPWKVSISSKDQSDKSDKVKIVSRVPKDSANIFFSWSCQSVALIFPLSLMFGGSYDFYDTFGKIATPADRHPNASVKVAWDSEEMQCCWGPATCLDECRLRWMRHRGA